MGSGNPRGTPEDEKKCVAQVYLGFCRFIQCSRKRGHGPDDEYCKQHAKMIEEGRPVRVPKKEGGMNIRRFNFTEGHLTETFWETPKDKATRNRPVALPEGWVPFQVDTHNDGSVTIWAHD